MPKANYKRMIEVFQLNQEESKAVEMWYVYILECVDGTYYTGVTKDIDRRFQEHDSGKGARYTRTRTPVKLVYQETCQNQSSALIRECAIKALPREKKKSLVLSHGK